MDLIIFLIPIALKLSIATCVFSLGLRARLADLTLLLSHPGLFARSVVSMSLVMPAVALALISVFTLKPPVAIAIAALSLSPIPPLLPRKGLKAGAGASYVFSLLVTVAILAVAQMPLGVDLIGRVLGHTARVDPLDVALIISTVVLAPLLSGMIVHKLAPALADRLEKPLTTIGTAILAICMVPILVVEAPLAWSLIGDGTVLAFVLFIVAGLVSGHLLGGPLQGTRIVLALSTAARHPGVALAVAVEHAPDKKLVMAAIVLYLLLNAVLSSAYLAWARSRGTPEPAVEPS